MRQEIEEKVQEIEKRGSQSIERKSIIAGQRVYLFLPLLFLTVILLGGIRLTERSFVFISPDLLYFVFAFCLFVSFLKARLISVKGWFSEDFPLLKLVANAAVLLTLFGASVQVFNSLIPEQGLPFLVFSFCFLWILWHNLFIQFSPVRIVRSLIALFVFAFVAKYIVLAYLTAPAAQSWWEGFWQDPVKETLTWLLDLPRFSPITGYIQFFVLIIYLIGLLLIPPSTSSN